MVSAPLRGTCVRCKAEYADLMDHIRKQHADHHWTPAEAATMGIAACGCGAIAKSAFGLRIHYSRTRCSHYVPSETSVPRPSRARARPAPSPLHPSSDPQSSSDSEAPTPPATVTREQAHQPDPSRPFVDEIAPDDLLPWFYKLSKLPTMNKPVFGSVLRAFKAKCKQLATLYVNDPTETNLFWIMALPKIAFAPHATSTKPTPIKQRLQAYPHVRWVGPKPTAKSARRSQIADIVRQVENGKVGRAARLLSRESKVADVNDDTLDQLRQLHPPGRIHPFALRDGYSPGILPTTEQVQKWALNFKADTACGISGWTFPLMKQALDTDEFLDFLTLLCRQIAQGDAPGVDMLCCSRITPLVKPNGKVRPIAVGELFYRACMKTLLKHYASAQKLLPRQFGVGSAGGVEPLVHLVEQFATDALQPEFTHLIALDFKNAFNRLPRTQLASGLTKHCSPLYRAAKWAYGAATPLIISQGEEIHVLQSREGVRQGDPMGPLLFSVGVRDTIEALQSEVGSEAVVYAYLDDMYLLAKSEAVFDRVVQFFERRQTGLSLNVAKCAVKSKEQIRTEGTEILGSFVGPQHARRQFLLDRIRAEIPKFSALADLPKQHALLILRLSLQQNLRHLMRTLDTADIADAWDELDEQLWEALRRIRNAQHRPETDAAVMSLPLKMGGCGLLSYRECAPHARTAARQSSAAVLAEADGRTPDDASLMISQGERCRTAFQRRRQQLMEQLDGYERRQLLDNASQLGTMWLHAIPYDRQHQLSDADVSAALHLRTLCRGHSTCCTHCSKPNAAGHDELCDGRPNWRLARHEMVKRLLAKCAAAVDNTTITMEPAIEGTAMRTDFRVTGPASLNGSATEYDLTICSPLSDAAMATTTTDDASALNNTRADLETLIARLEQEKRDKYEGRTATAFQPLVLLTGGTASHRFRQWMAHLRMGGGPVARTLMLLSLTLVRCRARFFSF